MHAIKLKIASNRYFLHFIAYCFTFIGYGSVIFSLGSVVPYFTAATGATETAYSFLFFWRAIGFMFGALLIRFFEKYFAFHTILILASTLLLIFLTITCFVLNMVVLGVMMFLIGTFCCTLEIVVNVCVLQTQKNGDIEFWMLIVHGMFGFGGLVGPIYVYIFQINSFAAMGLTLGIIAPFYWYLKTPQNHTKIQTQIENQRLIDQIKNEGHEGKQPAKHIGQTYSAIEKKSILKPLPNSIAYLICFLFFIYVGLQTSYAGWVSSYAVLQNIATKQQSTRYGSIYWATITIFRFIFSCSTMATLQKLFILSQMMIGSCFFIVLMIWMDYRQIVCIVGTVLLGICYSGIFPLMFSVPQQFNFQVSTTQTANFIIWVAIGQGVLATLAGYLMAWFSNDMLYYMTAFMAVIFLTSIYFLYIMLQKEKNRPEIKTQPIQAEKIQNEKSQ